MGKVEAMWSAFCAESTSVAIEEQYQIWYFGNSSEMAPELAELVISGKKTATASLKSVNDIEPESAPVEDGYSVVTDFEGNPMCIIQTTEIRHIPFNKVDAQFAFDEGEGDQSLEFWRHVHWSYFTKEAAEKGVDFDENSIICCECFKLVFPE